MKRKAFIIGVIMAVMGLLGLMSGSMTNAKPGHDSNCLGCHSNVPTAVKSITINAGATSTRNTLVNLSIASYGSPAYMRFATSQAGLSVATWFPYSTVYSYTLPTYDGAKAVWAQVKDGTGKISVVTGYDSILLDTHAPVSVVSAPVYSTSVSRTPLFRVAWAASDPYPASGVASYYVQYKVGAAGLWTAWKSATPYTYAYFSGSSGYTYYFRVLARDRTGNTGLYSLMKYTVVPYDNLSALYSGSWGTLYSTYLYRGSARYSTLKSSAVSFYFRYARAVTLIMTKRPGGGYARVYIGTTLIKTIDLHAATTYRVPVLIKTYLVPTSGSLRVVVAGLKSVYSTGYRVEIDGIAIKR